MSYTMRSVCLSAGLNMADSPYPDVSAHGDVSDVFFTANPDDSSEKDTQVLIFEFKFIYLTMHQTHFI